MECVYRLERKKVARLAGHDYSRGGLYFITICANNRACLFGDVIAGKMCLNDAGLMVQGIWERIPIFYQNADIFDFQVMPNHLHGIISVSSGLEMDDSLSLSELLRRFKTLTTNEYMKWVRSSNWESFDRCLWQRGFYDRVIRNANEFDRIRNYIVSNPLTWEQDSLKA